MGFRGVFTEFLRRWWRGPTGRGDLREFFYSIGDPRSPVARKSRGLYALAGVELEMEKFLFKRFRDTNMFYGIGFTYTLELEPQNMLYDRIVYDFDSEEDPRLALRKAIEFARSLEERFGCSVLVVSTGFKGAHVVIPLRRLVNWEGYQLLWKALIAPYGFKSLVDRSMLQWNRLDRIPYTYNVKLDNETGEVVRRFTRIVYPKRLRVEDFEWSVFEPLEPSSVEIVRIELPDIRVRRVARRRRGLRGRIVLPSSIEELANSDAVPSCIRSLIDTMVGTGELSHYGRVALVLYLKWLGYDKEEVIEFFARHAKDYNERITRYQVEYLYGLRGSRKDYKMYSCRKMKELGLCLGCGWDKNPLTYTVRRVVARKNQNIDGDGLVAKLGSRPPKEQT